MNDFFRLIFQSSWFFMYFWYITLPLFLLTLFAIYKLIKKKVKVKKLILIKLFIALLIPFIVVLIWVIVWRWAEEPYSSIAQYINLFLLLFIFLYQSYLFYTLNKFRLFLIWFSLFIILLTFANVFTTAMFIADDWM